jgi:peptidoglycan/xylan/chitin deacetylase (PgdA/CDA1 family)
MNLLFRNSIISFFVVLYLNATSVAQEAKVYANEAYLKKLMSDSAYLHLRNKTISEFSHANPGKWGEFVKGVDEDIDTGKKIVAFTFDACGGKKGNGYDKELIDYLRVEKIPATLFVTGKWIDANFIEFLELSKDTLFEIENHGFNHKPCTLKGDSIYGIHGTKDIADAFDEIEANAFKIEALTHRFPHYYRSATAFTDEGATAMAAALNITTISFQVLSGDAIKRNPASEIESNVLKAVTPGAIIIMHFNHPEWNTFEAMVKIIPVLKEKGYSFVRLGNSKLISIAEMKKSQSR